jgi:hypothetical protein
LTFTITEDMKRPEEKDVVDWGTVPHLTSALDENEDT